MLTTAVQNLGFVSLEVPGWELVNGLGEGRFSSVYSCRNCSTINADLYVLKVFRGDSKHLAITEKIVLTQLSDMNVRNIPIFRELHETADFNALILTPLGVTVLPCAVNSYVTPRMIVTLLQVIRSAHNCGWIHRDIKPDNIFFDRNDARRIVLNDWSSAARTGIECFYLGTKVFGDPPNSKNRHIPTPQLDLRCLVRTAFCLSKQRLPILGEGAAVEEYWARIGQEHPPVALAMGLADSSNYDALVEFFETKWL